MVSQRCTPTILGHPAAALPRRTNYSACWEHEIVLEQTVPRDPGQDYPVCVAYKGDSPVEYWSEANRRNPSRSTWPGSTVELAALGGAEE